MRISGITYVQRPTNRIKKIIIVLLSSIIILSAAVAAVSAVAAYKTMHPGRDVLKPFNSNIAPDYREVTFISKSGDIRLKGWYFNATNSGGTVILVHSQGKNRLQFGNKTFELIRPVLDRGFDVLTFDLGNSGSSGGKLSSFGISERNNVLGAIDYAERKGGKKIILAGFETGANAALLAAAESPVVTAIIADTAYSSLYPYLKQNINRWTRLPAFPFNITISFMLKLTSGVSNPDFEIANASAKISPRPVLLIHSRNDQRVPYTEAIKNLQLFNESDSLTKLYSTNASGNTQSFVENTDEYLEKFIAFLEDL